MVALGTGGGTRGPFNLTDESGNAIYFEANADIDVYRYATDGTRTQLTESTDYTLTGGPSSGVINLTTVQAVLLTNEKLVAERKQTIQQMLDLVNSAAFSSSNVEARFDILCRILQEVNDKADRGLLLSRTELTGYELPPARNRGPADSIQRLLGFSTTTGEPTLFATTDLTSTAIPAAILSALAGATDLADLVNDIGAVPVALLNAGQLQGFKNRLINGCGAINQRAAASNADDTYAHDRWNILTQTGAVACTTLTDPENGAPTGVRITQSQASAQRFGFSQIIESGNCRDLRSTSGALSMRIRCSASTTIRYAICSWTGTADSVTSDIVLDWTSASIAAGGFFLGSNLVINASGSVALTANTWTDLAAATTLSSGLNNVVVFVWTDSTQAQNVTLDFNRAQFEPGAVASVYEARPLGVELALCQRYYQAGSGDGGGNGWSGNTTNGEGYISWRAFHVQMRAAPTVTLTNVSAIGFGATPGSATATVHGYRENRTATATDVGRTYSSSFVASAEL